MALRGEIPGWSSPVGRVSSVERIFKESDAMSMSDPVADMLTRIRNGIIASHDTVDVSSSKLKINIAKILKAEGFIKNYKVSSERELGVIKVFFEVR